MSSCCRLVTVPAAEVVEYFKPTDRAQVRLNDPNSPESQRGAVTYRGCRTLTQLVLFHLLYRDDIPTWISGERHGSRGGRLVGDTDADDDEADPVTDPAILAGPGVMGRRTRSRSIAVAWRAAEGNDEVRSGGEMQGGYGPGSYVPPVMPDVAREV